MKRLLIASCSSIVPVCLASLFAQDPATKAKPVLPEIKEPVMFNTPEADKIMAAVQMFPANNPWNEDISKLPVAKNSAAIIASMGAEKRLGFNRDMSFIIVPPNQKRVDVKIVDYAGESDRGPYPVPDNAPIEDWPANGKTLEDIQRNGRGDRHMLVLDPVNGKLFEFYIARRTDAGWQCAQASLFDLNGNTLRPNGWTSSDAAGLPVLPAVPRFEECEAGAVRHALRVTARRTRRAYVYPATHYASRSNDANLPRMGERFRLKADVDISGFAPHARAIAQALKTYGMFMADNGQDWLISTAPDARLKGLDDLRNLRGKDFEVVQTTGPNEGPRAR